MEFLQEAAVSWYTERLQKLLVCREKQDYCKCKENILEIKKKIKVALRTVLGEKVYKTKRPYIAVKSFKSSLVPIAIRRTKVRF
jgi:hypothetical protein